jgi:hypothetical protein
MMLALILFPQGGEYTAFWLAVAVTFGGVIQLGLLIAASIAGIAAFDAYPRISIDTDPATLALAAAGGVLPLLPFAPAAISRLRHPLRPAPLRVGEAT